MKAWMNVKLYSVSINTIHFEIDQMEVGNRIDGSSSLWWNFDAVSVSFFSLFHFGHTSCESII